MNRPDNKGKRKGIELQLKEGKPYRKWQGEETAQKHTLDLKSVPKIEQETAATVMNNEEISVTSYVTRDILKLTRNNKFTIKHVTTNNQERIIGVLGRIPGKYVVKNF